jgi:hypothetical protein
VAKKRTIPKDPSPGKNYFLLDANVFAYAGLPRGLKSVIVPDKDRDRVQRCIKWLSAVKKQCNQGLARVYIPDVVIAEAFKVLAKWYFKEHWFSNSIVYNQARERLRRWVARGHREMARAERKVTVHDEPVSRDVIIAVDRFFEPMFKAKLNVQIADLLLLAIAKYLMDFYDIPKDSLFILTCDKQLVKLTARLKDLPTAIDPTDPDYDVDKTFVKSGRV